jgi:hypothetical protein
MGLSQSYLTEDRLAIAANKPRKLKTFLPRFVKKNSGLLGLFRDEAFFRIL